MNWIQETTKKWSETLLMIKQINQRIKNERKMDMNTFEDVRKCAELSYSIKTIIKHQTKIKHKIKILINSSNDNKSIASLATNNRSVPTTVIKFNFATMRYYKETIYKRKNNPDDLDSQTLSVCTKIYLCLIRNKIVPQYIFCNNV